MFFFLDGEATHLVNGASVPLHARDLVFIRPFDTHDYQKNDNAEFSMLNLTFTKETVESLFAYLGEGFPSQKLLCAPLPPMVHLSELDAGKIHTQMDFICALDASAQEKRKTAVRTLLFTLFTLHFGDFQPTRLSVPKWLSDLCEQMQEDGNFMLGTPKLFSLTDKSREHVCRSMRKYYHMSVTEYVNLLRLNYIASMLKNSNHSIADIIFESGFNHIGWASEVFLRRYGMSMRAYREMAGPKSAK